MTNELGKGSVRLLHNRLVVTRYGTLIARAEELGHEDVVRFLTTNLNEEKAANTKLNTLATRRGINSKAAAA